MKRKMFTPRTDEARAARQMELMAKRLGFKISSLPSKSRPNIIWIRYHHPRNKAGGQEHKDLSHQVLTALAEWAAHEHGVQADYRGRNVSTLRFTDGILIDFKSHSEQLSWPKPGKQDAPIRLG